jgi:TolB protein
MMAFPFFLAFSGGISLLASLALSSAALPVQTASGPACDPPVDEQSSTVPCADSIAQSLRYPQERHLRNITQLTFGGDNAEAYWAYGQNALVWQYSNPAQGVDCDQIYWSPLDPAHPQPLTYNLVSTGGGRTTCAYFLGDDERIIYASTQSGGAQCPPDVDKSLGYVWPLYPEFEIYVSDPDGGNTVRLTENNAYDAEATLSPKGDKVVFTSTRNGDLDLFTMNPDGTDVRQVTFDLGYDGGAFFSPDGERLIFRASRPRTPEEVEEYRALLARNLVKPMAMELFTCKVDGSDLRQITELGGANWAPFFTPDGQRILFCSNHKTGSYPFNLYLINLDGTGLEQVSFDEAFDSFPMFSPDGRYLLFSSNRNNGGGRSTNVFVAEWVD